MPVFRKFEDFNNAYEKLTAYIRAECVFGTTLVGGQPADEEGVRQFVIHHLKITDEAEREKAVQRILHEEIEDVTEEGGELPEGKVYGLRAIRRDAHGPFLGDWMVKACIKNAASRLGLFKEKLGTKGAFAEAGRVRAWKYSLQDPQHPNQIYVRNSSDETPAHTSHETFRGRVQGVRGAVSIMHESEVCDVGSRFAFEFRFINDVRRGAPKKSKKKATAAGNGEEPETPLTPSPSKLLTLEDVDQLFGLAMIVGLGSARSMERGKFRIENAEIEL